MVLFHFFLFVRLLFSLTLKLVDRQSFQHGAKHGCIVSDGSGFHMQSDLIVAMTVGCRAVMFRMASSTIACSIKPLPYIDFACLPASVHQEQ